MFLRFFLQVLPVPDTTAIHNFAEKLEDLRTMPFQKVLETIVHDLIVGGLKVILGLVIFLVGRWVIRYASRLLKKIFVRRHVDLSLRTFLLGIITGMLYFFLIVMIISLIGLNISSFIAIFASAGLAVGIALSGMLQNFAGGVMILLFKPYRVGDYIEAQGQEGAVTDIQLFNTVLNTADNKRIILPNGPVATGIINNYSQEPIRRVEWIFGIAYGDDYDRAKAIIRQLLDDDTRVLWPPPYFIALHALSDNSVKIVARAWVKKDDFWDMFFDLNESVYKTFSAQGFSIPFPQMEVHLRQHEKKPVPGNGPVSEVRNPASEGEQSLPQG